MGKKNGTDTDPLKEPVPEEELHIAPSRERLIEVLQSLEAQIAWQTSLKWAFLRGVIYGLGTVIGATILLALLGGIFAATIESLSDFPFIGNYVGNDGIEQYINEAPQ